MTAAPRTVTCAYCGHQFAEDRGQASCGACPLTGGCHWVRCPHCGYENPDLPGWMGRLAGWMGNHAR
ncbi:MAG: hypothetical protein EXR93_05680 [Gemmatimonadetes bacterium]|nr:hypothetical protein [Gemmatimonadota bacterium]